MDAYILKKGEKYNLVYEASVHYVMDGMHVASYYHSAGEWDIADVVISHYNHWDTANKSLHNELLECLGDLKSWLSGWILPDSLLPAFGGMVLTGADSSFTLEDIEEEGDYYKFDDYLYIAKDHLHGFGLGDAVEYLDEENKDHAVDAEGGDDEEDEDYEDYVFERKNAFQYSTSRVDIFMTDEDYDKMIKYLYELVGKMNEVYAKYGEEQIDID